MVSPPVGKVNDIESVVTRKKTTLSKMFPMIWPYFSVTSRLPEAGPAYI